MIALDGMTQAKWDGLTRGERERLQSTAALNPQLIGLEGWRVEVTTPEGETRRFIVGKSTGWGPIHLEIKTARSMGGFPAMREYAKVVKLRKVR